MFAESHPTDPTIDAMATRMAKECCEAIQRQLNGNKQPIDVEFYKVIRIGLEVCVDIHKKRYGSNYDRAVLAAARITTKYMAPGLSDDERWQGVNDTILEMLADAVEACCLPSRN